jgi:RHS repeat-associated protein
VRNHPTLLRGDDIYNVHADHLGSPRKITDQADNLVWQWQDKPFGDSPVNQDPDGDGIAFVYNLRFPGQYYDAETGLHYNYFRYYDPWTGRYITSDPIGLAGGLNTYTYVGGNPITRIDPKGLFLQAVIPFVFPSIGQAIVDVATIWLGGAMIADSLSDSDLQQEVEKGANNAEYHRTCNEPPPPNFMTPCDKALWELQKVKSCLAARKAFTDKWHNGVDERHDPQLYNDLNNRLKSAEQNVKRWCECDK